MAALGGPFVQGTPRGRFVYVDIGTYAGQAESCWSRRLKIPLDGIPVQSTRSGGMLEARAPGRGRDGGPGCATVFDFDGWNRAIEIVRGGGSDRRTRRNRACQWTEAGITGLIR